MDDPETILCSNCKRDVPTANADLHLSHCVKHLKLCELCDDAIPIREFEEHLEEEHRELQCSKCNDKFQQGDEDAHQRYCTRGDVKCEYCELEFPRCEIPEHLDFCGTRTDTCDKCEERLMLKNMLLHVCNGRVRRPRHAAQLDAKTTDPNASTSPYALQPFNNAVFNQPDNFHSAGADNGTAVDYLDELIATDHLQDPFNGSTVDLDVALAAQLAHDARRQEEITNRNVVQPDIGIGVRPRSKGTDDMLPCEFCETMVPLENLILHQTGCIENSILAPNQTRHPPAQISFADPFDSFIPCEFCCKQFPVAVIAQHQEGCTPTRRVPSYSQIVDERPIRPAQNMPTRTANTQPAHQRTTNTQPANPRTANTQPPVGRAARPTKRRTPAYTPSGPATQGRYNGTRGSNSQNVSEPQPEGPTAQSPVNAAKSSIHTRPMANPRGIRKEQVPKPKMTLGPGKEPLRVKNSRVTKASMNDLDKASSACPVPTVVIPKRKQQGTADPSRRGKQEPNGTSADTSSNGNANNNNDTDNSPWGSPKIINRNVAGPRDSRATNGRPGSVPRDRNDLNNLSSTNEKATTGKNIRIDVTTPDNGRNRQTVLNKYQRDKTFVVAKNNED